MKSNSSSSSHRKRTTAAAATESPLCPVLLSFLGITFLIQLYNLWSRPWALAFVAATYSNLLLLLWCVEAHDRAPRGSRRRKGLRPAVWLLSSSLIVTITCRVAGMMPLPVQVLLWAMAGATVAGTAYGFFLCRPNPDDDAEAAAAAAATTALEP